MPITLYGLKNCETCKKALKALETSGHTVHFVDIRTEADLTTKVPGWLKAVGPENLMNTRSTTWRSLSETERQIDPQTLLTRHPTLIKRPVIETAGKVLVGWKPDGQVALLA